jgi:hypothetical protein
MEHIMCITIQMHHVEQLPIVVLRQLPVHLVVAVEAEVDVLIHLRGEVQLPQQAQLLLQLARVIINLNIAQSIVL